MTATLRSEVIKSDCGCSSNYDSLPPPVQGYVGFGGLAWPGLAKLKSRYSSLPSLLPVGGSFHVSPAIGRVREERSS